MLGGLMSMFGHLILYIVYGKEGMKRRKYKPLTMIALSMIFMIWLILIILVVGTANPSEIVPGIISIIIFPAAISAWAVIARKKIQQEIDLENNSKT